MKPTAITCYHCGIRFNESDIIYKVDMSIGNSYHTLDIRYYCINHIPQNIISKSNIIKNKAKCFNDQLRPETMKGKSKAYKRKFCKKCGAVFMTNENRRIYCSRSCASSTR
jgi:ribosomal protein S27AE